MSPVLHAWLPEAVLAGGALMALIADLAERGTHRRRAAGWAALAVAALALLAVPFAAGAGLQQAARVGILAATLLAVLIGQGSGAGDRERGEFHLLVLGLAAGAMLMAGARDLLTLYVGLETTSLCGYCLAGWPVRGRLAAEAGIKYVLVGAIGSALFLYGASWAYGLSGTLDLAGLGAALPADRHAPAVLAALLLLGCGFAYKLALAPFHWYAPDVYQGAPAPAVAALAVLPKIGGFAALASFLILAVPPALRPQADELICLAGGATAVLGALAALRQDDAQRLLGFSAVSHAGAMLPLLACGAAGIGSLAFYLLAYAAMNLAAFAALSLLVRDGAALARLAGAWRRQPIAACALALAAAALAGVPPLAGFLAKWTMLQGLAVEAVAGSWPHAVAALAVLAASAIAIAAYLKLVRAAWVDDGGAGPAPAAGEAPLRLALAIALLATIGLGMMWHLPALLSKQVG